MKKQSFLFVLFILLVSKDFLYAQAIPQLPEIIPMSPEASAITKAGQQSVGLISGYAQANIPLYELKMKGYTLPIGLQYSSGGLKVDEIPSRVGLSWNLTCSGIISRSVHGRPDDASGVVRVTGPTSSNPPNPPSVEDIQVYHNSLTEDGGTGDAEPDEFFVTAPGLSTKFFLDNTGQVVQIPYSNIKIEIERSSANFFEKFIVTNTDGTRYEFGGTGAIEKVLSINLKGKFKSFSNLRTGFYLKRIVLPNGEFINYDYDLFSFKVYSGIAQTIQRGEENPPYCQDSNNGEPSGLKYCPPAIADPASFAQIVTESLNTNCGIHSITSSSGQSVVFEYEEIPGISSEKDSRIKSLTITGGDFYRKFDFTYTIPTPTGMGYMLPTATEGEYNPRFFLKEVSYRGSTDLNAEVLRYKMDYVDYNYLPRRLSFAQDLLGFYNGYYNSTFLPAPNESPNYWQNFATANRSFNGIYSQQGMLERITFPTGGSEAFEYEPNTESLPEPVNSMKIADVAGSGNSTSDGTWLYVTHESLPFNVYKSQTATVSFSGYGNPGCTGDCTEPVNFTYASATIKNITTGETNLHIFRFYGEENYEVALDPGEYKISLKVRGLPNAATILLNYDAAPAGGPAYVMVNKEAGGVRVKAIHSYDPIVKKLNSRFFSYAQKTDLSVSSGYGTTPDNYIEPTYFRKSCVKVDPYTGNPTIVVLHCTGFALSSNSTIPINNYSDHISYSYVIESDDPEFKNGGIQHRFDTESPSMITTIVGNYISAVPLKTMTSTYGNELETEFFDRKFETVKKTTYNYDRDVNYEKNYTAIAIRKKYPPTEDFIYAPDNMLEPYDETHYLFTSLWNRLVSVSTTEYINGVPLEQTSTNIYRNYPTGNPLNISPIKTETINSKGENISVEMKYPTDYSVAPYTNMVTKNIIAPVIETTRKNGTTTLDYSRTDYNQWYSSSSGVVIEPQLISTKKGSLAEQARIRFYNYDNTGNPVELSKENDTRISYIWDYNNKYVIAEAKNATAATVAYTSFEADGTGKWNGINSANIISGPAATGKKFYSGTINLNIGSLPAADYFVTYWSKNGSYTVTGTKSGWPKTIRSVAISGQTWTLYEHRVTASGTVSVSGTGAIDELRFHPADAQMVSYTYSPFVGVTSQSDPRGMVTYYQYDAFGRLKEIRDFQYSIVKTIDYNYKDQ